MVRKNEENVSVEKNDTKRHVERAELHRTIWNIANELRGSVDGWDFKQYVLGFLFYRFISEKFCEYFKETYYNDYNKNSDEDVEIMKEGFISEQGFFIKPSQLFSNVLESAKKDYSDLNLKLSEIFKEIEKSSEGQSSNENFKGLFEDIDVNSKKLGENLEIRNKKLLKIMEAINSLNLGHSNNEIDTFGDTYEFLMTMYASSSGKSGGEFFTPQEVSNLLAEITLLDNKKIHSVYDPTCGSGSLLLKFRNLVDDKDDLMYYGQEINITTYNLSRINMFLHNVSYEKFKIRLGDTLKNPKHLTEKPFDVIVSNPPYSIGWDANELLLQDERFSGPGVLAPAKKADLAFILHSINHLSQTGTAAIVEFPGVLYRTGSEAKIRRWLIEQNKIDAIIQLPQNLFFGTNVGTCIIVLKNSKKDNNVLFIDASNYFEKIGKNNVLTDENKDKILELLKKRETVENVCTLVSNDDIYKDGDNNNYDLSVNTFVKKENTEEKIDIDELERQIEESVKRSNQLRKEIKKMTDLLNTRTL